MKLKDWLKQNRYKQVEFAKMIGCSTSHLSNVLRGHSPATNELCARITEATKGDVTASDLANT